MPILINYLKNKLQLSSNRIAFLLHYSIPLGINMALMRDNHPVYILQGSPNNHWVSNQTWCGHCSISHHNLQLVQLIVLWELLTLVWCISIYQRHIYITYHNVVSRNPSLAFCCQQHRPKYPGTTTIQRKPLTTGKACSSLDILHKLYNNKLAYRRYQFEFLRSSLENRKIEGWPSRQGFVYKICAMRWAAHENQLMFLG